MTTSHDPISRNRPHWRVRLVVAALIGTFFAVISPFGAVEYLPFPVRFIYWTVLIILMLMIEIGVQAIFSSPSKPPKWWLTFIVAPIIATPFVFFTILAVQMLLEYPVPRDFFLQLALLVWIVCFAVSVFGFFVRPASHTRNDADKNDESSGLPDKGFRSLLPTAFREAQIYAVSSEDHYCRVHTDVGETMILMRLSDATALLSGVEGLSPHRSWWVARAGIAEIKKSDGRTMLELKSGATAPVSRKGAKIMRALDW